MPTWRGACRLRLAATGVALGLAAVWLAGRWAQSKLSGFPGDVWWPYFGVAALVIALTQIASYLPARRAAATDGLKALNPA